MSESQELYCSNCYARIENNSTDFCPYCGQSLSTFYTQSSELAVNSSLNGGRFSVGESLGTGDFDITYVGYDFTQQSKVFIKEVFYRGVFQRDGGSALINYSYDFPIEDLTRKIQRECLGISGGKGLNNIVKINDWFSENNTSYIITEYIEGYTLEDWVNSNGRLTWNELYRKIKPMMLSLSALHDKGIFHRDINPQNIIIKSADMEYVLTNFALARLNDPRYLTSAVTSFSTGYAPYEQRAFVNEDGAYTDIYSIAATIYFALTGELPAEEMYDAVEGNFPRISMLHTHYGVPENVENGLRAALDPNVSTRCGSLTELMQYLNEENRQPHYLYGRNQYDRESEYAMEARRRNKGKSRQQVKSEYYERIIEKQKEDDRQQMEINSTLDKLHPKYARRVASYDRSLVTMKGLIIPAVFVAIIIFIIIMSNS